MLPMQLIGITANRANRVCSLPTGPTTAIPRAAEVFAT